MKVKELIDELLKHDPETEMNVSVYGCSGFDDAYPIDAVEFIKYPNCEAQVRVEISVGCDVHRNMKLKHCGAV